MHVLAIIDMQKDFSPSNKIILPIIREINYCKRKNWPIIIMKYIRHGYLIYPITKHLKNYKNKKTLFKSTDNGSSIIEKYLNDSEYKTVRCVGVNTSCCVYETVIGLHRKNFNVEVVYDACANAFWHEGHDEAISWMKKYSNVKIIRERIRKNKSADKKNTLRHTKFGMAS